MDGFYLLTALSIAMFVGSFLAGLIPLAFVMSEGRTRLLSTFGAGLLVGTALSVIIPEGVESLYTAEAERRALIGSRREVGERSIAHPHEVPVAVKKLVQVTENLSGIHENKLEDTDIVKRKVRELPSDPIFAAGSLKERKHEHPEAEASIAAISPSIGYSLVIGFIFMFIIDQISRSLSYKVSGGERLRYKLTATIGLVVHAAADGIALGSASATNRTDVQFIVFLAVMLHKAPAAFGLVSFLLVEGVERFRIRRHLFVFSIAAPLAALLTYYLIVVVGSEALSADSATGVLMLFSAGTFLYVATVHILPELVNSGIGGYQLVNNAVESGGHTHGLAGGPLPFKELASVIVGAICPTLLASGHSH